MVSEGVIEEWVLKGMVEGEALEEGKSSTGLHTDLTLSS